MLILYATPCHRIGLPQPPPVYLPGRFLCYCCVENGVRQVSQPPKSVNGDLTWRPGLYVLRCVAVRTHTASRLCLCVPWGARGGYVRACASLFLYVGGRPGEVGRMVLRCSADFLCHLARFIGLGGAQRSAVRWRLGRRCSWYWRMWDGILRGKSMGYSVGKVSSEFPCVLEGFLLGGVLCLLNILSGKRSRDSRYD